MCVFGSNLVHSEYIYGWFVVWLSPLTNLICNCEDSMGKFLTLELLNDCKNNGKLTVSTEGNWISDLFHWIFSMVGLHKNSVVWDVVRVRAQKFYLCSMRRRPAVATVVCASIIAATQMDFAARRFPFPLAIVVLNKLNEYEIPVLWVRSDHNFN